MRPLLFFPIFIFLMYFCHCNTNDLQKIAKQQMENKNPNAYHLVWKFLIFHFKKLDTVAVLQPDSYPNKSLIFRKELYKFLNGDFKKTIIRIGLDFSKIKNTKNLKLLRQMAKGYIIYLRETKSLIKVFSIMDSLKIHWDFETRFFVICEADCNRKHLFLDSNSKGPFSILNVLPIIIVVDVNEEVICEVCSPLNKTLDISMEVLRYIFNILEHKQFLQ